MPTEANEAATNGCMARWSSGKRLRHRFVCDSSCVYEFMVSWYSLCCTKINPIISVTHSDFATVPCLEDHKVTDRSFR